jgi:hypothetical protein
MKRAGLLLAALALSLHALWPLIAQAKPKSVHLVPICTVSGVTHFAEVPGGAIPAEQKSAEHFEHCALCTLGDERTALPAHVSGVAAIQQDETSFLFVAANSDIREFPAVRARAPPFSRPVGSLTDVYGRNNEEASALRHCGARAGDAGAGRSILRGGVLLD